MVSAVENKPSNGDPHFSLTGLSAKGWTGEVFELNGKVIHLNPPDAAENRKLVLVGAVAIRILQVWKLCRVAPILATASVAETHILV